MSTIAFIATLVAIWAVLSIAAIAGARLADRQAAKNATRQASGTSADATRNANFATTAILF